MHNNNDYLLFFINSAKVPGSVTINFGNNASSSISLSVSFDGDEARVQYNMTVTWNLKSCRIHQNYVKIKNMSNYTIEDLDEGSEYNISVVITNPAGNGSSHSTARTLEIGNVVYKPS